MSLQSLSPVFVDFSLSQQELSRVQTGLKVRAYSDSYADKSFEGEIAAINPPSVRFYCIAMLLFTLYRVNPNLSVASSIT